MGGTAQGDSADFTLNTTDTSLGVIADSADFRLNTTDASPPVCAVQYYDFTLDTTGTPTGIGGTAQSDSLDFTLNTTEVSPALYADSGDFTLNTTSESLAGYAGSPDFTLNTTGESPMYPGPAVLMQWLSLLGNRFQFYVHGSFGANYVIQANPDLGGWNWVSLFTNAAPFTFTQTDTNNPEQCYYRAVYFR